MLQRFRRYQRKKQIFHLDNAFTPATHDLRKFDPTARINIMTIKRKFFARYFEPFRGYEMEGPDADLTLRIDQGVVGVAFDKKTWVVGDLIRDTYFIGGETHESDENRNFDVNRNMDSEQRTKIKRKGLTLILSYPFGPIKFDGSGKILPNSSSVVGVVNVDSSMDNALEYYQSDGNKLSHLLEQVLPRLAAIAAFEVSRQL